MEYERSLETLHTYTHTGFFHYPPGLVPCHGENQATTDLPSIRAAKQFREYLLPPPVWSRQPRKTARSTLLSLWLCISAIPLRLEGQGR